jgi:hypothetical protein
VRWKVLAESVVGTAHRRQGVPCQDACVTRLLAGDALLVACADGAGSAAHADRGARLACDALAEAVATDLAEGQAVGRTDRDAAAFWLARVRHTLSRAAEAEGADEREFACTLVAAVADASAAVYFQVGDGFAVQAVGGEWQAVFWPEAGEYANETHFVTDADAESALLFARHDTPPVALALLTDGLQRLALDFVARRPFAPFFDPLCRHLRSGDPVTLGEPLRAFLDSERVNARTDDDKTLLLAVRVQDDAADAV